MFLDSDLEGAFDTTSPTQLVVQAGTVAGLGGEDLAIGAEMTCSTELSVHRGPTRSEYVRAVVGMPEGRQLSPPFFAIACTGFSHSVEESCVGMGLDPPAEAVCKDHVWRNGTDIEEPAEQKCVR